jgi:hypothetical protein
MDVGVLSRVLKDCGALACARCTDSSLGALFMWIARDVLAASTAAQ